MLGGEAVRYAQARGMDVAYPFKALRATLRALDVLFVNVEGPLFEDRQRAKRKPLVLANHPDVVEVLKLPAVGICSLANNHSLDYGPHALSETQRYLERHGVRHIGAGRTASEAERELVLEHAGWRIGCLAFTARGEKLRPVIAHGGQAGCASLQDRSGVLQRVRKLRKRVDLVVVMLHWGLEFHEYPCAEQVRLAHTLVDAGAHIIAGHHPHTLQAVETYNGAVIAYSLGHLFMPPFRLSMAPVAADVRRRTLQLRTLNSEVRNPETASSPPWLRSGNDGPVFCPRPASREFMLMRVALPAEFPSSPGAVDAVAGGLDDRFRLRPYNRIALRTFQSRLDNLGCPLRNGGYATFWRHYRAWRRRELAAWRQWPAAEESLPPGLSKATS